MRARTEVNAGSGGDALPTPSNCSLSLPSPPSPVAFLPLLTISVEGSSGLLRAAPSSRLSREEVEVRWVVVWAAARRRMLRVASLRPRGERDGVGGVGGREREEGVAVGRGREVEGVWREEREGAGERDDAGKVGECGVEVERETSADAGVVGAMAESIAMEAFALDGCGEKRK